MTATSRFFLAVLATFVLLCPLDTWAACEDGQLGTCTRNGCKGVRECVGGQWLGCEVPGICGKPPVSVNDKIQVDLAVPGTEVGVLYDGTDSPGTFNDRSKISVVVNTTSVALVPNILAPAFGKSVIAFAESRQPRMWPAGWTNAANTVQVPLDNNLRFNVTFWILAGNFATQKTNAAAAVLAVNNAYKVEKAGVRIAFVTVMDAIAIPAAATLTSTSPMQGFQTQIGFNAGEINVYVLGTVLGTATSGLNFNGTPVILLGQNALTFPQLLEHEIGHAFVLWHTAGLPGFNFENVMWPSISAHFLTEGQTFRMHFHPSSQLNVFGLRATQRVLICGEPMTDECPANNRRLWTDGSLPPN
jgi:hypothetical protein